MFSDYYLNNKQIAFSEHGFFKFVDLNKCIYAIDKASVKDLSDFRKAIATIYGFENIYDFFSEDIENIDKLSTMLQNRKYDKKMKRFNICLLQDNLKSILASLRKAEIVIQGSEVVNKPNERN